MASIIQLSGKKRAGKDTIANMFKTSLEAYGKSVEVMAFAEPLKDIVATILGVTKEQLDVMKNNPETHKIKISMLNHSTDARTLLQKMGTEASKKWFGDNVWVNLLKDRISTSDADYVIITDTRFICELLSEALTIRINSNMASSLDMHSSETELDDYEFNITITNDDYSIEQQDIDKIVNNLMYIEAFTEQLNK
jgi:hypothetical protein